MFTQSKLQNNDLDEVSWVLERSAKFSTKSLYNCLTHGEVNDKINDLLWKCKIPLKVKIFLWQAIHNKLQTAVSLSKKGWHGSPLCCVCLKPETVNHLLSECVFTQYIWCCIRDAFCLQGFPLSIQELISQWLPRRLGVPKRLVLGFFAGVAWAVWKNRNKMAIEKNFPVSPDAVIHMAINFVQMWAELCRESDRSKMRNMASCLPDWMNQKSRCEGHRSDIVML